VQSRLSAFADPTKNAPMGGDLTPVSDGSPPTFLLAALKDPLTGNLDRIPMVKRWLDAGGKRQEKVYDGVWGGGCKPDSK